MYGKIVIPERVNFPGKLCRRAECGPVICGQERAASALGGLDPGRDSSEMESGFLPRKETKNLLPAEPSFLYHEKKFSKQRGGDGKIIS